MKKIILSLAAVLLTLALFEGAFRAAGIGAPQPSGPGANPGANTATFREPLPGQPKEEGLYRIVALGDSYTWGYGLADGSKAWPPRLEAALYSWRERVDVVNLGVPGFTTVNELEMLGRRGLALEPDMVIVQYLVNDVLPSSAGYMRHGEEWLDRRKLRHVAPLESVHEYLQVRSYLYRFTDRRFQSLQRRIWPPLGWHDMYRADFPGWRDFRKALSRMGELGEEKGFRVLFVLFPTFPDGRWTAASYPLADIYEKVSREAEAAGLEVLNLVPAFAGEGRDFGTWHVSDRDSHPGSDAHALAARAISHYLMSEAGAP